MKVIIGLGNPGRRYEQTRHNVGFWVVASLAERTSASGTREKWNALVGETAVGKERVFLVQPLTYMNRSGECVGKILNDLPQLDSASDLIVVYDDLDLPPGVLRLRQKGSAGGHNGMKSVITAVGHEQIQRIRVGIGRPDRQPVIDYVLDRPDNEESMRIEEAVDIAVEAVMTAIEQGFETAMNRYN